MLDFDFWATYYRWKRGELTSVEAYHLEFLGRFAEGRAQDQGMTILPATLMLQEWCDRDLWIAAGMVHLALCQQQPREEQCT